MLPSSLMLGPPGALIWTAVLVIVSSLVHKLLIVPLRQLLYYRKQRLRGTEWTPILGDIRIAGHLMKQPFGWHDMTASFRDKHGYVHYGFLGPELRLRLFRPDLIREVLVTKAGSFHKPDLSKRVLGPLLGMQNLLLSEDATHRRHRAMISPSFHFSKLKGMASMMTGATSGAVDAWLPSGTGADKAHAHTMDVHVGVSALTLDIIGRAAFGHSVGGGADAGRVYTSLSALLAAAVDSVLSLRAFVPGYSHLPTPFNLRVWRDVRTLREILQRVVAERRALRRRRGAAAQATAGSDGEPCAANRPSPSSDSCAAEVLVDLLLDARASAASAAAEGGSHASGSGGSDHGRVSGGASSADGFTDAEVRDEAMTFLAAGHETTAQALCWTMLLLAENPQWKARAREQVLSVVGREREPVYEDLASLPLLTAILNESLRLYPPVPLVARVAVEDVTLEGADDGGLPRRPATAADSDGDGADGSCAPDMGPRDLHVQAGTALVIPIAAIHRDPLQWRDPHAFDPTRFEAGGSAVAGGGAGSSARAHPMAFLPFSAGPRSCVGANFALLEARLVLATMLQRVDWEIDPAYHHHPVGMITLRPKYGMPMRLWRLQ